MLEKDPLKRPRSINDLLTLPFHELDDIKLKLQQTILHDANQSSNFVGRVKDLRTGKFSDPLLACAPT
jgi:hypothetical protein